MIATICKGGNILAKGTNDYDRKMYEHKYVNGYKYEAGLHAELDAIRQLTKDKLKGTTMIIYGNSRIGNRVTSKPCKPCMRAIKAVGIKQIKYYVKEFKLCTEKI